MSVDDIIRKAYYNPSEGFVGREKLYRKLRPHRISRSDIAKFLVRQEVYQTSRRTIRDKAVSFLVIHCMNFKLI